MATKPLHRYGRTAETMAYCRVRLAIGTARAALDRYAMTTDAPKPGVVEAADHLDAADACLRPLADLHGHLE